MSWDYDDQRNCFVFDESDYQEFSDYECPNCGSYNTVIEKVLENEDIDGRRGRIVNYLKCYNCGYDEN